MSYIRFLAFFFFLANLSKYGFWVADWGLVINTQLLKDFLEIFYFPKILGLKAFNIQLRTGKILLERKKVYIYYIYIYYIYLHIL